MVPPPPKKTLPLTDAGTAPNLTHMVQGLNWTKWNPDKQNKNTPHTKLDLIRAPFAPNTFHEAKEMDRHGRNITLLPPCFQAAGMPSYSRLGNVGTANNKRHQVVLELSDIQKERGCYQNEY